MKKICFVAPKSLSLFTNINYKNGLLGGGEKQLYYIGRELCSDSEYDIHFCVADYGQKEKEVFDGITVWKSFAFGQSLFKRMRIFYKTLKNINADIYVFRSADVGILLGLILVKYFLGKKFLYMVASDSECSSRGLKKAWNFLTAWSMGRVYRWSDKLTVQSNNQEEQFMQNRKIKPGAVVKNSYLFTILPEQIDEKKKKTVLWVGRCQPLKRPEIFIELASLFPDLDFVMIAPSAYKQEVYFERIKKSAENEKNLRFISYVPPHEIKTYYKEARIYVTTSEWEGFSNTMMEAMECRCPVASLNVNPDSILEKFSLGFCAENDKETFFSSFGQLIKDQAKMSSYGQNARLYLEQNHGIKSTVDQFKGILK